MEIDTNNIIISNIADYTISFYNGNMILTKKKLKKNIDDLKKYNFKKSNILKLVIDNIELEFNKYKKVIKYLYEKIDNINLIETNTLLNIIKGKKEDNGFNYLEKLNISVQGVDANKSIKEIIHISNICNIKVDMKIKLENNEIINL